MNADYFTSSSSVSSNRVIYTPSSFARFSLIYLQEIGSLKALSPHVSTHSNLSSFLFFVVTKGYGALKYNGIDYELKEGDCVFIDCMEPYEHRTGDLHENNTNNHLWSLSWCHFYGPQMQSVYEKYISRGGKAVFQSSKTDEYLSVLSQLFVTAKSSSYVKDMQINSLLSSLLVLLMEDSWNPENLETGSKKKQVVSIRKYIDGNYATQITLDDLAEKFYINKTYISEIFKEQYGINISDYIASVRITEAKKLLRFTDKTTEEIATLVGVNGAAYFSRLFKKIEGVTPNEYRKMW